MRSVSGGLPAIAQTQASQMRLEVGARTRWWSVKLSPIQSSTRWLRSDEHAHT